MVCVVVTQGGFGSMWRLPSREEAFNHPLYQYGDAVLSNPDDIVDQYNLLEIRHLLGLTGDEQLEKRVLDEIPEKGVMSDRQRVERIRPLGRRIFDALVAVAQIPPSDPECIVRLIREDRTQAKEIAMSDAKAPEKEKAAPKKRESAWPETAKIVMQKDKDGKTYGKDNNPKRATSKSAGRFAKYKDGATVADTLKIADGPTNADLRYDSEHGYIKIAA